MAIKLGTVSKILPYSKVYLGDVLKYQLNQGIEFSSCPFPSSWTKVTFGTAYKASNSYGQWNINATGFNSSSSVIASNAFDKSTSTYWAPAKSGQTITIECPCLIKPTSIYLMYSGTKNTSKVEGFDGSSWITIHTLTGTSSSKTETVSINTNSFFSKFRITLNSASVGLASFLYEFQIKSGYIQEV